MNDQEERRSSDLLAELEESIPQGVPNSTQFNRRATDQFDSELADLDSLLNESVSAAQVEAQYKADRAARSKGYQGMSKEEVEFCNSRMHAFEMAREWDADRAIAVFTQYVCTKCETGSTVFSRLMERHQHRRVATTFRWQTVTDTKLELETVFDQKEVPMCTNCLGEYGLADPQGDVPWLDDVLNERSEG